MTKLILLEQLTVGLEKYEKTIIPLINLRY